MKWQFKLVKFYKISENLHQTHFLSPFAIGFLCGFSRKLQTPFLFLLFFITQIQIYLLNISKVQPCAYLDEIHTFAQELLCAWEFQCWLHYESDLNPMNSLISLSKSRVPLLKCLCLHFGLMSSQGTRLKLCGFYTRPANDRCSTYRYFRSHNYSLGCS